MVKRSILKTITWRITASTTTLLLVYIISGQLEIAGAITLYEIVVKTLIYYLHEKVWEKAKFDKKDIGE